MIHGNSDHYVYIYIDPRNYEWFYVGKGRGSRKEAHLFDEKKSEKAKRIRAIQKTKLDPTIRVVARDLTSHDALLVEKTLIWQSQGRLLNLGTGHFKKKFRPDYTLHKDLQGFDFHRKIYFFNVGDGKCRKWEDNIKYNYVGAGHKPIFRDAISGLSEGDVIVAYLNRAGYVGVGIVRGKAQPARDFRVNGKLLIDFKGLPPKIGEHLGNDDLCEWMTRIEWKTTVKRKAAHWRPKERLFTSRLVRASLENQPETVRFVERCFNIDLFKLADS